MRSSIALGPEYRYVRRPVVAGGQYPAARSFRFHEKTRTRWEHAFQKPLVDVFNKHKGSARGVLMNAGNVECEFSIGRARRRNTRRPENREGHGLAHK